MPALFVIYLFGENLEVQLKPIGTQQRVHGKVCVRELLFNHFFKVLRRIDFSDFQLQLLVNHRVYDACLLNHGSAIAAESCLSVS